MTKISRYVIDDNVTGSDKWIGSDAQTGYSTKNFTPTKLAVYFNENQVIDIGTPIRYKYDILELGDTRLPGTITFNPQVGTPYGLANISSFILSKYTLKGNDVTEYLNFLISSSVLIYKADNINIFGLYKVISLEENLLEPTFFDVVLEYITGNGSIVEDKDYLISLINIPSDTIPTKTSELINDGEDGVHPFITIADVPVVTGFVPYTGATGPVNLGAYDLTVNGLTVGKGSGNIDTNTAVGSLALSLNTTGFVNTAIGVEALKNNTTGYVNTAVGYQALLSNTTGYQNTSIGSASMPNNTVGYQNIAIGQNTLQQNSSGFQNTAVGFQALNNNTNGNSNTAVGYRALSSNTTGTYNNAFGHQSMLNNTGGRYNSAYGEGTLYLNTIGRYNTAIGSSALFSNISAWNNTASGYQSLNNTTTGGDNSAYGAFSLRNNTTGIQNVGLGVYSQLLNSGDSNSIVIGANATGAGSNTVVLGNDSIVTTLLKGNVGIDTTAPSQKLHVAIDNNAFATNVLLENTNTNSSALAGITLKTANNAGTFTLAQVNASGDVSVYNASNSNIGFSTNALERMRITASGNLGVNTVDPSEKLHIVGNARITGSILDSNNQSGTSGQVLSSTVTGTDWVDLPATSGFVPYTGATSDVNLGEFGVQLGNIEFDLTPTNTPTGVGSMLWNDTAGTLDLKLKGGNVTLQIGQETVARVVNKTATNITLLESNYQAVRVTGAQGQRPKVDLALANNDLNSTTTLGLVTENILNNQEGFITTSGQVQQINTTGSLQGETWADGDVLYLSGTVAGRATNIKPIAPIHTVILGFVEYAHITQGKIFVKVDNGYELEELHNVSAIAPNNNEALVYDSATLLWKPKTIVTALGYTPENILIVTNRQTTSYTLSLTDISKLVETNVATANNLTIPLSTSVNFPIGTSIDIVQYGAGQTTIVATSGVTIRSANNWLKINARYGAATLTKIAIDEWYLWGNLNA